jgi:hypothetical protein
MQRNTLLARLAWFGVLWIAGVATLGVVTWIVRMLFR